MPDVSLSTTSMCFHVKQDLSVQMVSASIGTLPMCGIGIGVQQPASGKPLTSMQMSRNQLQKRFGDNVAQVLSLRGAVARSGIINIFFLACLIKDNLVVSNHYCALVFCSLLPGDAMGWFWIAFACRPQVLWRNLIATVALLALLVDLADTCQGQVKCQLVVDTLKGMVFLVLPLLSTWPQHNLVVPGVSCPLLVTSVFGNLVGVDSQGNAHSMEAMLE